MIAEVRTSKVIERKQARGTHFLKKIEVRSGQNIGKSYKEGLTS